jgi:hypothetical protein
MFYMKKVKKFIRPGIAPALLLICLTVILPITVFAETVHLPATRDTTLIEDAEGDAANGSGSVFFAGSTNQPAFGKRRGLVYFDVAATLPKNAIIDFASLRLYQESNNPQPIDVSLFRLLADWGEGVSSSSGGRGKPAEINDSTWLFSHWPSRRWQQQGGEFLQQASATITVAGNGSYNWPGTSYLINDVRLWQQKPQQNFGWLVMGDENTPGTAKRFTSKESAEKDRHPVLLIKYHLP